MSEFHGRLAIARNALTGGVRIDFGRKIAWIEFPPEKAIEFAKAIAKHAGAKKIEIE